MFTSRSLGLVILAASISTVSAELFTSAASGDWSSASLATWSPAGNPQTGSGDSAIISNGHVIIFTGTSSVGLPGSGDLGVAGNQTLTIDGGAVLSQAPPNFWIRIGHGSDGTLNINDGRFHFTNSLAGASPNLQVGIQGGNGIINIGDGIGAPGTAVLNLRDIIDGTRNEASVSLNLAANEGATPGRSGTIVIKADGLLESDSRGVNPAGAGATVRIGQHATPDHAESLLLVDGGLFRAHGQVEVGVELGNGNRANGRLAISNSGRMEQDAGELNIGWHADGAMVVDNGGVYSKTNGGNGRTDVIVGREATGVGSLVVDGGGEFRIEAGDVADLRIGLRGTGTMTINNGGIFHRDAGNWDWVGQQAGSNGTLTINAGGLFRTTGGSNLIVGVDAGATGLVLVNGGTLDLQSTSAASLRIGQNGNGTFRQVDGVTTLQSVIMAESSGTAAFELQGGSFTTRSNFFVGGINGTSAGTGVGTVAQSGGTLNVGGAFVIGLATGHTGTFTATGGQIFHTGSDTTIGENGTGTMTIGPAASFTDTTGAQFMVGRNDGSSGTLFVDGTLTRSAASGIRVGNGNTAGVDNTNAPGLLGGIGSITSNVFIGARGTLTGGTLASVGDLDIAGALNFSPGGVLFANFDTVGNADRINTVGTINITDAVLDGNWLSGGVTGLESRYWLMLNDDLDPIVGTFLNASTTSPFASLYPEADAWAVIDGQDFAVFYDADFATGLLSGGNDLLVSAVPEPATVLLLGGAFAVTALRRRRSRENS